MNTVYAYIIDCKYIYMLRVLRFLTTDFQIYFELYIYLYLCLYKKKSPFYTIGFLRFLLLIKSGCLIIWNGPSDLK